jgi:hypothetical protein
MDLIPLLGSNLKSDAVIELLELWDCDVIYDFDRLHETTPDQYWASPKSEGLQLRFDEDQVLRCVFVHVSPSNGDDFSAADLTTTDIPQLHSPEDVLAYAESNQLQTNAGRGVLFDQVRDWVRIEYSNHSIHYEFRDGALGLVTISGKA